MVRSNAKNDSHSLSKAEKIEGFRRLCKEQFTLIMDSVSSVLDQMRLVRVLEAMGEEAQVTFPEVFLKLKKLIVELNQLFQIMQNYCDN
jgi:recombinational DNA repair ATPase RecF